MIYLHLQAYFSAGVSGCRYDQAGVIIFVLGKQGEVPRSTIQCWPPDTRKKFNTAHSTITPPALQTTVRSSTGLAAADCLDTAEDAEYSLVGAGCNSLAEGTAASAA